MTVVLVHIGPELPGYLWTCVEQIRRVTPCDILLCASKKAWARRTARRGKEVTFVPLDTLTGRQDQFERLSFFSNYGGDFWHVTFQRLFVIEALMDQHGIDCLVHIENDVMLYADPLKIDFSGFQIMALTPVGPKYSTYAYCYVPSLHAIRAVNDANLRILAQGSQTLNARYGEGMVNEMLVATEILRGGQMDVLPVLPDMPHAPELNLLFDGASYGQYLGGTRTDPPGWTGEHHYCGMAIRRGDCTLRWTGGSPVVEYPTKSWPLANLHIHSKQLKDFCV